MAGRKLDVFGAVEVYAGITVVGPGGQRKPGVETNNRQTGRHGGTDYPWPGVRDASHAAKRAVQRAFVGAVVVVATGFRAGGADCGRSQHGRAEPAATGCRSPRCSWWPPGRCCGWAASRSGSPPMTAASNCGPARRICRSSVISRSAEIPRSAKSAAMGRQFDPAAFVLHRGWVGPMVLVVLDDAGRPDALLAGEHPPPRAGAVGTAQLVGGSPTTNVRPRSPYRSSRRPFRWPGGCGVAPGNNSSR